MAIVDLAFVILLRALPVIGWVIAIVFAVVMLKRGGGKAERFLVAGASLMLVSSIIGASIDFIIIRLRETIVTNLGGLAAIIIWPRVLLSLAGYICLGYAFWTKFKIKSTMGEVDR